MSRPAVALLLVLLAAAPLYFIGAASTGFQGTDELRYGKIAAELEPGRYMFLLRFNGEPYSDKPPPYFWAVRAGYELLGGVQPLGLRLPGILSALGSVALTFLIALRLIGRTRVAVLAALTLMIMPRFLWIARWGRLDIMMCLFVYAGMYSFVRRFTDSARPRLAGWIFWLCLGASFAVKGPAGIVVMLGTALIFLAWQGELPRWRELFFRPGIVAALAINLAWSLPILLLSDAGTKENVFVEQAVGRHISSDRHAGPPWYYLENIWYDALPAALLLAFAGLPPVIARLRRPRAERPPVPADLRFLISWAAFTLAFFSIYGSKRSQYLLPMYPSLAILSAIVLDGWLRREEAGDSPPARRVLAPAAIHYLILALAAGFFLWHAELIEGAARTIASRDLELAERLREAGEAFEFGAFRAARAVQLAGMAALAAGAGVMLLALARRRVLLAHGLVLGSGWICLAAFFGGVTPAVFPDDDLRRMSAYISSRLAERPELSVCMVGDDKPFCSIYGSYPMRYFDEHKERDEEPEAYLRRFEDFMEETGPVLLVMNREEWRRHRREPRYARMTVREATMRGERLMILESPAVPGDAAPPAASD